MGSKIYLIDHKTQNLLINKNYLIENIFFLEKLIKISFKLLKQSD